MSARSAVPDAVWSDAEAAYGIGGYMAADAVLSEAGYRLRRDAVIQHMHVRNITSGYQARKQQGGRTTPALVLPPHPENVEVRAVYLGDTQVPEIDYSAHRAACQFLAAYLGEYKGPQYLFVMGDMIDVATLSRFDIRPDAPSVADEIAELKRVLADYRNAAPKAEVVYLAGNHEWRVERAIRSNPALGILIKPMRELLDLEALGIKHYVPYLPAGMVEFAGSLLVTHGYKVGAQSGYSAQRHLTNTGWSTIHGHSHRLGITYRTYYDRTLVGVENGSLCLPQHYVPGVADWQLGWSYTRHWGTRFEVWQARVLDGKAFAEGRWFGG
jgi:hypothetical protein